MGNRVVKFRGLDKRYNVWRFGSLVEYDNGQSAIVFSAEEYGRSVLSNEVIPETVGQYTGLKDKNGVKIFEGDVMHNRSILPQGDKDLINEIQAVVLIRKGTTRVEGWNENGYIGEEINRVHYACLLLSPELFEVIGDIHDNPELMGERM